jgi:hypothetical protein
MERRFPGNGREVLSQSLEGDQVVFLFVEVLFKRAPNVEGL